MAQVLTSNRLADGDVVYWRAGDWVPALEDAEVFAEESEAKDALAEAQLSVAANKVVAPYLFELRGDGRPVQEREIIRALGPSVRSDLGKQAYAPTLPGFAGHSYAGATRPLKGEVKDSDDVSI